MKDSLYLKDNLTAGVLVSFMMGMNISRKKQKLLITLAVVLILGGIALEWLVGHDVIPVEVSMGSIFGITMIIGLTIICCISTMQIGSYASKIPEYGEMEVKFEEGMQLFEEGELREAIKVFKELMGPEMNHKRALFYTADAYRKLDEPEKVKKYITKYLDMQSKDEEAWRMLGDAHKQLFEYEEAEEAYAKADTVA